MSIRTKLLSGRNINIDSDFSKYIETVSEPGVIEGLEVQTGKVKVGKAWCPCERTNGETIYALVENFSEITIDTTGTGYVIISIPQNAIDDGSIINEDGTNVASISVVSELPTKNYLELAELDSGTITDSRNMIKKVGELNTAIESLTSFVNDIDERVRELEEAGAIDHLEEYITVGENYTAGTNMFVQATPSDGNSTAEDCHVGDVAANTEIHIQRIGKGVAFNTINLKVKSVGSPTTSLKVEVREGIKVNVSNSEAYWYGDESKIIATGSAVYSSFSNDWATVSITLNDTIEIDEGKLVDIVVYQESGGSKVVNASNYYILGCANNMWSEAFSYVSVNGTTRSRSKLCPYCSGSGLQNYLLVKCSTSTVNGFFPKLKTQEFTGSGGKQSSATMSPSTLAINESKFQARIYTNGNTLQYSNNFAGLRVTGKSYSNYYSYDFGLYGATSGNTTPWTTVNKDASATVYMVIGSLQGSLTASGPVYLDYYERTTQAISKGSGHKLYPKEVKAPGNKAYMVSYGRLPGNPASWWTGE